MTVKILLLQLKRIGDLILTTPAIAALRESFPDAHVTLAVSNECADLLPAISNVDRDFDCTTKSARYRDPFLLWPARDSITASISREMIALRFLTLLSGARRRVASYRVRDQSKTRARLYTDLVGVRVRDMHTIDYNLALLEPLGIRAASSGPQLHLPQTAHEEADALRRDWKITRPYLILHPGSARREKLWEPERWAELIEHFGQNNDFDLVLTSGPSADEQTHISAITKRTRHKIIDLSGKTDLLTLAALIGAGTAARHSRFGSRAFGSGDTYAAGDPVRADESVSLAAQGKSRTDFARKIGCAGDRVSRRFGRALR